MEFLDAALTNLRSPAVLAFALGALATLVRSDLRLPEQLAQGITMYLLLAIGLKGGVSLADAGFADVWLPALGTLALGVVTPLVAFSLLRRVGRFGVVDSAALAAHYGSVSLVTFAASITYLETLDLEPEGYVSALLTLLEIPAIIVALVLAKAFAPDRAQGSVRAVLAHVLPERSVVLLLGGLVIGWITGRSGYDTVAPFVSDPFSGILMLFLLQMGAVAGRHLRDVRAAGWRLVAFAVVLPLMNGVLGALVGWATGLSVAGATVLACMAASASYIAAPAAVSMALPTANPGYYLTAAIGITFPFNVSIGIPLYYELTTLLF